MPGSANCSLLADECASAEPTSRLYADALSLAMIQRLVDLGEPHAPPERGGLPPFKLRQVTEYMHAHLGDDIGLQELAGLVGISPSYFSRAFKDATGLSPHQWLILARCERAKFLLMQSRSSLAEVALEVGFYDQAHFTRLFTQHIGVSPGLWRRSTTARTGQLAQRQRKNELGRRGGGAGGLTCAPAISLSAESFSKNGPAIQSRKSRKCMMALPTKWSPRNA